MRCSDASDRPTQVASNLAERVGEELGAMEADNRRQRELGGYCLTLFPDGGQGAFHPALNSGD